jgi:tellurite resistance protein
VQLLNLLFAVAAADGGLTHAELEELRGISAAMNLSHTQYINAKLRAKR